MESHSDQKALFGHLLKNIVCLAICGRKYLGLTYRSFFSNTLKGQLHVCCYARKCIVLCKHNLYITDTDVMFLRKQYLSF